jgi:murein DD-endopeptidase MepM/ murein hydrolase activator NlpD
MTPEMLSATATLPVAEWSARCLALLAWLGREAMLASLLFAVVWPLARLLRRRAPALTHALWALVLLRLVLPVGWAAPWSARALAEHLPMLKGWVVAVATAPAAAPLAAEGMTPFPPTAAGAGEAALWPLAIAALWLLGALACLGLWSWRRSEYRRLLRRAEPELTPRVLERAEHWRRRFRIRRSVRLRTTDRPVTPFTAGLLRPVIVLPRSVASADDPALLDPVLLDSVLAHEMAHVARFDALWLTLQHWLRALYFFHPLAWIANAQLSDARERLCDRLVLSAGEIPARAYARSLVAVLRLSARSSHGLVPTFAGSLRLNTRITHRSTTRRLAMRLSDLLDSTANRRPRLAAARLAALALALFLLPMAATLDTAGADEPVAVASHVWTPRIDFVAFGANADQAARPLINPLPNQPVSSGFGPRKHPFNGEYTQHRGIDLSAPAGTAVHAAAAGTVQIATVRYPEGADWGTVIVVDHGYGMMTFYSHLDTLAVNVGDQVSANQIIGAAGTTGKTTGPHLHFEVWVNGTPVDPAQYIRDFC